MKTLNLIHISSILALVALFAEGCSRQNPRNAEHVKAPAAPAVPQGYKPLTPAEPSQPDQKLAPQSEASCFTLSFHHKAVASHSDEEACAQHQNKLTLKHKAFAAASLCVRVNDTPVAYRRAKGHPDQILIGAVAGPKSKITARYCMGKSKCPGECKIPKDEFMEAIGGDTAGAGQWDGADSTADIAAAEKATAELRREMASESAESPVFGDWVLDDERQACSMSSNVATAKEVL